jgi:hypothetical protein
VQTLDLIAEEVMPLDGADICAGEARNNSCAGLSAKDALESIKMAVMESIGAVFALF